MKKILVLLVLFICSCSPTQKGNNVPVYQDLQVQGDGNFGVVEFASRPLKSIVVKNNESSPVNITPIISGLNSDKFYAVSLGCGTVQPNKNCLIKVIFNGDSEAGDYVASLLVGVPKFPFRRVLRKYPRLLMKSPSITKRFLGFWI